MSIMKSRMIRNITLLLFVLHVSCSTKVKQEQPIQQPEAAVSELPNVTLIDGDGKQFSATTLSGKSVLIFFITDCDHCQREAQEIQKNLKAFESYNLYFISMEAFPVIKKFAETYQLDQKLNVHFLKADGKTVFDAMGYIKTPTVCIYNSARKLAKRFDGETKVEDIIKAL